MAESSDISEMSPDSGEDTFDFKVPPKLFVFRLGADDVQESLAQLVKDAFTREEAMNTSPEGDDLELDYELAYAHPNATPNNGSIEPQGDCDTVPAAVSETCGPGTSHAPGRSQTQKKNARNRRKRARKVATMKWSQYFESYKICFMISKKHAAIIHIQTALALLCLPTCKGCFVACPVKGHNLCKPTCIK